MKMNVEKLSEFIALVGFSRSRWATTSVPLANRLRLGPGDALHIAQLILIIIDLHCSGRLAITFDQQTSLTEAKANLCVQPVFSLPRLPRCCLSSLSAEASATGI